MTDKATKTDPPYHRRSVRLCGFNYGSQGAYFVTICAGARGPVFSTIVGGEIRLSAVGDLALQAWTSIPEHFPSVSLDAFVVMPDHLHGVIVIETGGGARADRDATHDRGARHAVPLYLQTPQTEAFGRPIAGSLPTIVRSFKAATTKAARDAHLLENTTLWQRGYYEHVIRDEVDLDRVRKYIEENPIEREDAGQSWLL